MACNETKVRGVMAPIGRLDQMSGIFSKNPCFCDILLQEGPGIQSSQPTDSPKLSHSGCVGCVNIRSYFGSHFVRTQI